MMRIIDNRKPIVEIIPISEMKPADVFMGNDKFLWMICAHVDTITYIVCLANGWHTTMNSNSKRLLLNAHIVLEN